MNRIVLIAILAAGCGTRVGYVDPERAIQQTDEWRAAQSDAKAYADSRQPELDAAKDALQKARADKAPAEQIVAKETKYGELFNQVNAEVKRRTDAAAVRISAEMTKELETVATERGVAAIAYVSGAAWVDPKLDVTADLAKHCDARAKAASVGQVADLQAKMKEQSEQLAALRAGQGSPPLAKK